MQTTETPRIWIGCLASYNAGTLHGEWIDATDADEIYEAIDSILKSSPEPNAEEWIICDHENFCGISIYQYASIEEVARLGALVQLYGEAFAAFAAHVGQKDATADDFDDHFRGHWDTEQAFAEELFDECYSLDSLPESIRCYFDYAAFSRDLFINDFYAVDAREGGVYVFCR